MNDYLYKLNQESLKKEMDRPTIVILSAAFGFMAGMLTATVLIEYIGKIMVR